MAVTINKAKAKTKAAQVQESSNHMAEVVDALGELKKKMDAAAKKAAPLSKQYAKLESELLEYTEKEGIAADGTLTIEGDKYEVEISAKGNKTEVTENSEVVAMLDEIEDGLSFALMKFGITDLRKYLTPKQFDAVSITERVNKRRVKLSDK